MKKVTTIHAGGGIMVDVVEKTTAPKAPAISDVDKRVVLHAIAHTIKEHGVSMTLKQIQANATEYGDAHLRKVLAALVEEGKLAMNGKLYEGRLVYACCKQPHGSDHAATCPKFPGAKACNATPAATGAAAPTKLADMSVEQMRLHIRQHPKEAMKPAFIEWCKLHKDELVTPDQAITKLKEAVATDRPNMYDTQRIYEVQVMLAEQLKAFHLQSTDRIEMIPPSMAKLRNRRLDAGKRWTEVPPNEKDLLSRAITPGFITNGRKSPADQADAAALGREQEDNWWNAYLIAKEGPKGGTPAAPRGPSKAPKAATGGATTIKAATPKEGRSWMGIPMTTFMRYCAHRGMSKPDMVELVQNKLKLPPSKTTMNIQHSWGLKKLNLPTLSSEQLAAFETLAGHLLPKASGKPKPPKAKAK